MNGRRSPERLLDAWLATEAPPRPPAGLRDDIVHATARIRPRPGWLARLKGNHMDVIVGGRARRDLRLIPMLALLGLLLVALVGAAVVGSRLLEQPRVDLPVQSRMALPAPVVQVVAGDDAVWVATTTDPPLQALWPEAIHRVDLATGAVETVVDDLPDGIVTFAVFEGSIWGSYGDGGQAIRWDAKTGERLETIPLGAGPLEPLAAYGWVWYQNFDDGTVTRIDPATGTPTTISTGWVQGPRALAAGGGLVWAVSPSADWAIGIDPSTATIATQIRNLSFLQSCGIGFALERVWVFQCEDARAELFDSSTGESVGLFEPPNASGLGGVFEHDGRAWVHVHSGAQDVSIVAVDPTSLDVIAAYETGLKSGASAIGPDALWFADGSELVKVPFGLLPKP
jgi:hypothetical protein